MPFEFDATGIEPSGDFSIVPEGDYSFEINDFDEKLTKDGNNMISIKSKIIDHATYGGEILQHSVVFKNRGEKGAGLSLLFLKSIGMPYKNKIKVNPIDWVGKKFSGHVEVDLWYSDQKQKSMKSNKIVPWSIKEYGNTEIPF